MALKTNFSMLAESHYISCPIPNAREPEIGILLSKMSDHQRIYDMLLCQPDITITSIEPPARKFLVSLAEDTVNADGFPTNGVRDLSLERRRRLSLFPEDGSFRRFDISFKDAEKSDRRREWAENSECLRSGEQGILLQVARDIPDAARLDPDSYRVRSVCITSRSSYDVMLQTGKNAVIVEVANDACVITNPHADRILGYRKEVEMEIKEVLMSDHRHTSEADINAVIDQGMLRLRDLLTNAALKGRSVEAVDSKVKHANTLVDLDYGAGMASHYKMSGGDWALLQNVQAFHFMGVEKRDALIRLTETIPPPELLMPFSNKKKLKGYFPDEEIYPSAFGPGLAA